MDLPTDLPKRACQRVVAFAEPTLRPSCTSVLGVNRLTYSNYRQTLHPVPNFREDRATQAAARLLQLQGSRMNVLKLIKLLYLVDRTALVRFGRPVTFDSYVSMPHGPVLSLTLDRINAEPNSVNGFYWHRYISERQGYDVQLAAEAPYDQLSQAEEEVIDEVFARFGHMTQFQLRDWCHEHLPEWKDPQGSSTPIEIADVLRAEGFNEDEARSIEDALAAEALIEQIAR